MVICKTIWNIIKEFSLFIWEWITFPCNYIKLYRKGRDGMSNLAINYASLIMDGLKTFESCNRRLKEDVAKCLISWGYPELITEDAYKPVETQ